MQHKESGDSLVVLMSNLYCQHHVTNDSIKSEAFLLLEKIRNN